MGFSTEALVARFVIFRTMVSHWPKLMTHKSNYCFESNTWRQQLFLQNPFSCLLNRRESSGVKKPQLKWNRFRLLNLWVQKFHYESWKHSIKKRLHLSVAGTLNTICSYKYALFNGCDVLAQHAVINTLHAGSLLPLFGGWSLRQSWNMGNTHTLCVQGQLLCQKRNFAYFQWTFLSFLSIVLRILF